MDHISGPLQKTEQNIKINSADPPALSRSPAAARGKTNLYTINFVAKRINKAPKS